MLKSGLHIAEVQQMTGVKDEALDNLLNLDVDPLGGGVYNNVRSEERAE